MSELCRHPQQQRDEEMNDMECPYCGAENEVCHDDGHGYAEDQRHEHECWYCKKSFVFTTSISFSYYPEKADCLNGAPHKLKRSSTYPPQYAVMQCEDCEYSKPLPSEEFERLNAEYEASQSAAKTKEQTT